MEERFRQEINKWETEKNAKKATNFNLKKYKFDMQDLRENENNI